MRLVLCDDHRILGEALAAGLEARGHDVVAIATTAADGIAAVAAHQPDVCLLDLHFPDRENGLDVARAIRLQGSDTKVLVLSGVSDRAMVLAAINAGISGFIRKDQRVAEIADALEIVAGGGAVFDPGRARTEAGGTSRGVLTYLYQLTPREREVLRRIVDGQSTDEWPERWISRQAPYART